MTVKHEGLREYRFKENPEEKRFADAWKKENSREGLITPLMDHMLGNGTQPVTATQREATVAATVIQWLGSPVGQCFLRDLSYERKVYAGAPVGSAKTSPDENWRLATALPKKRKK
jgi:hypothetical protein